MSQELSQAIVRLFEKDRFYANLILQMDRIISNKVPTLGVCIKDRIQLHVNLDYFNSLSKDEQIAVLKHECAHIYNNHILRAKELAPDVYSKNKDIIDSIVNGSKHKLINIASDCSINTGIPNIPKEGVFPKTFNLEDGHLMEWYVENLKNNEKMKNLIQFDGHSLWSESEGEKEELKEKIKKAINDAANKTKMEGCTISSDLECVIERLNHIPKDWKSDLRRFSARTQESVLFLSKKKRNRRYGILYPGIAKEERLHLGVAIDTSGSISDVALNQFFAEICNISKYAKITVVEADSEVKASYEFDSKKKYSVKGRGGTAYQPAFDFFSNETDVDGVVYLGDMDCFDEELKKPKYPVLWAIVGDQDPPAKWGSITKIEVKNK